MESLRWSAWCFVHCRFFRVFPQRCRNPPRVQQREAARSAKDFATADAVRDELRQYGVELKDKERQWMTAGGRAGNYQGGTIQAGQQISAHNIRQLIAERERL